MPERNANGESDFITERIKIKPVNRRKLVRRTLITVAMAVIFGLVACITFLTLEPVISNWLYPKEEPKPEIVVFPEDQDEMLPEDMLAENQPGSSSGSGDGTDASKGDKDDSEGYKDGSDGGANGKDVSQNGSGEGSGSETDESQKAEDSDPETGDGSESGSQEDQVVLGEEQVQEILAGVKLDLENYRELYAALREYADTMSRCMVMVTALSSDVDWFNDVQEKRKQCHGLIISDNGMELLILADYSPLVSAEKLLLTFHNGLVVEGQLKKHNGATNLAVLSVPLADLPEGMNEDLPRAEFGYSNGENLVGTPVVALGSPMGSSNSLGYGMITSSNTTLSVTDRNYKLIQTDINGSQNAGGILFNLDGKVIGIIANGRAGSDKRNIIAAYGITELRRMVEKLSNASPIAYMGIRGVDVSKEAYLELGVPYGAYVENVEMDSPAMRAGIQRGDVIIALDDAAISNFNNYSNALLEMEPGRTVNVKIMRQAQEEYKEMSFSIELGEVEG